MIVTIDGIAGSGKSSLRDELLKIAAGQRIRVSHVGQFSWLSFAATKTVVSLRAGRTNVAVADATEAMRQDLALHYLHNIGPESLRAHVIADRLLLSSAALLSLLYGGPAAHYVRQLAPVTADYRHLTVLLTTPPAVCAARTHARPTRPRFGENGSTAAQLHTLTREAAAEWTVATGQPIVQRSLETPDDTAQLASEIVSGLGITPNESEG